MSVFLYRYLKKKYNQRRQGATHAEDTPQLAATRLNNHGDVASQQLTKNLTAETTKAQLTRTILLMVALAIPVFLETLDYTGTFYFYSAEHNSHLTHTFIVVATAQVQIAVCAMSNICYIVSYLRHAVHLQPPRLAEVR
jgi:hypothetical protein